MKEFSVIILVLFFSLTFAFQTNSRREMADLVLLNGIIWTANPDQRWAEVALRHAADLVVLSRNIFEIPPEEIQKTEVKMTVFNGKVIYRK